MNVSFSSYKSILQNIIRELEGNLNALMLDQVCILLDLILSKNYIHQPPAPSILQEDEELSLPPAERNS